MSAVASALGVANTLRVDVPNAGGSECVQPPVKRQNAQGKAFLVGKDLINIFCCHFLKFIPIIFPIASPIIFLAFLLLSFQEFQTLVIWVVTNNVKVPLALPDWESGESLDSLSLNLMSRRLNASALERTQGDNEEEEDDDVMFVVAAYAPARGQNALPLPPPVAGFQLPNIPSHHNSTTLPRAT